MPAEPRYEHGEVPTRSWVVELILDLAGYTSDKDLAALTAVDPCFGRGAFLVPMVRRLRESADLHGRDLKDCTSAIVGVDIQSRNVRDVSTSLEHHLCWTGVDAKTAKRLVSKWIRQGDFLLDVPHRPYADFVIGNPPYVRLEEIDQTLVARYRENCPTMSGRADLYIGFFEAALRSLRTDGTLAFICADRWMRNAYGRDLRALVLSGYSVETVLSMHDVDAFEHKVSAYPAVTVIKKTEQGSVVAATASGEFDESAANEFVEWAGEPYDARTTSAFSASVLPRWFKDDEAWPSAEPQLLALLEYLNEEFAPLQDLSTGTRVGIGIATGNDGVYITDNPDEVESDRLLPLALRADIATGQVDWHGTFLVNPWEQDGSLVDLSKYPLLQRYFERHREALTSRHVGGRNPETWYRTIDKVDARIVGKPKLLFPDLALRAQPTLCDGSLYPHHNLYWVASDKWDLDVLGGLLLSKVCDAFVGSYGVRMRGGTLRFQAQNLRRIRVPDPDSISAAHRIALAEAFNRRDAAGATEVAIDVYDIPDYASALERHK